MSPKERKSCPNACQEIFPHQEIANCQGNSHSTARTVRQKSRNQKYKISGQQFLVHRMNAFWKWNKKTRDLSYGYHIKWRFHSQFQEIFIAVIIITSHFQCCDRPVSLNLVSGRDQGKVIINPYLWTVSTRNLKPNNILESTSKRWSRWPAVERILLVKMKSGNRERCRKL